MKTLIFLHYRGGSSFFQHLTGHTPKFLRADIGLDPDLDAPAFYFMTTNPKDRVLAQHIDCGSVNSLIPTSWQVDNFCILTHIGDWWGLIPTEEIPRPLESPSTMKWGPSELKPFWYDGWKFVNILRDGRNLVESTRRLKGGFEEELNNQDPKDYFLRLCLSFRNKGEVAFACRREFGDDYRILRFEDMYADPISFIQELYQFAFNLDADHDTIQEKVRQIRARKNTHSSFSSEKQILKRYKSWTEEEKQVFRKIAGSTQRELGYQIND